MRTIFDLVTGKDVGEIGEKDVAIGQRILFQTHLREIGENIVGYCTLM